MHQMPFQEVMLESGVQYAAQPADQDASSLFMFSSFRFRV